MKVNWSIVAASIIAGLVILVVQEYMFKRTVNSDGTVTSKPIFA